MYDLIGDIHGHADELVALLAKMGYREARGVWRHPERFAVFVGDFIDRGPKIWETLKIVRAMIEAESAQAVLGNHEWNAFSYHLRDPADRRTYLREHSKKNRKQHAKTIAQVRATALLQELGFLRKLPFWLPLEGANVVHACWDEESFAIIDEALARHGELTDEFVVEGSRNGSRLYAAIDVVLKGREMDLPDGVTFSDKDGHERHEARVRWWESPDGASIASYSLPRIEGLPNSPLPADVVADARPYPADLPPVFFGHYWLNDPKPTPLADNVVCLDYSVANRGFLCAYRLERDGRLIPRRFVTVASN